MNGQSNVAAERIQALGAEIRRSSTAMLPEGSGRGLVVVAGGARMFTNAYVLLHVLRHTLKSQIPVELWHFGQSEISPAMVSLVDPLGVRLVDAVPLLAATGADIKDGWQLKSFALAHSRFAEVLLLDADQVPISDPAACFDWEEYKATGAVFWPDAVDLRADNPVWSLFGIEARRTVSLESGQLLVDRRRHGAGLSAALRMNEAADELYKLIYGDKDTYLLAWELLGEPYALVPHRPYRDDICLIQRDFQGNALFQHRTNAKWQYGSEAPRVANFVHEEACRTALATLVEQWSGRVFTPPDRTVAARAIEQHVVSSGPFRLYVSGEHDLILEFRPHAEIGLGRDPDRRHWWVEDDGETTRLVLSDGGSRNYVVERGADHVWRGTRFRRPVAEISLVPEGGAPTIAEFEAPGLVDELLRAGGVLGGHDFDEQKLANALGLLAEVVPDVRKRLFFLATKELDHGISARLQSLANRIATRAAPSMISPIHKLEIGYIRAEIEG